MSSSDADLQAKINALEVKIEGYESKLGSCPADKQEMWVNLITATRNTLNNLLARQGNFAVIYFSVIFTCGCK